MAIVLPDELQEVTVSAMPPTQLYHRHAPARRAPRPLRLAPRKPTNPRRTIRPNLNAKRVNTVIPASENIRGDVPEEDKGGRLFAKPYK